MACCNFVLLLLTACLATCAYSKIILPHKLRYLENMLNSEVVAKANRIRQRIAANPNTQESEKDWPLLLAKYQEEEKKGLNQLAPSYAFSGFYNRRFPGV